MERLPYIDEHATSIAADRATCWTAVLSVMCRDRRDPSSVPPGFHLESATPPDRFALHGRHPFAVYRLVFELTDDGPGRTRVAAQTFAAFPGAAGTVYRAIVIGTGGHGVVVRRMLGRIAALAERNAQPAVP
jgi:hypothetical protein